MKAKEIKDFCLSLPRSTYDYKEEWHAERGLIGDKMFMMFGTDKVGRPIVSVKVDPDEGLDLRLSFSSVITEGYYLNKRHWISIYQDQDFDSNHQKELIRKSYELVFSSFSKKKQAEILAQ